MSTNPQALPSHIAPSSVREFPLLLGATTTENPFDRIIPEIASGPPAFYAREAYLRMEGGWIFCRVEDLQTVYRDTTHFSNKNMMPFAKLLGETWSGIPMETDPPMHTAYRALLNPLMSPQRMAALDEKVREHARRYIDKFKNKHACEFMAEFAFEFPIAVFLELMGLPQSDAPQLLVWEHQLLHDPDIAHIAAATRAVKDYLLEKVAERRKDPKDDILGFAATAQVNGRPFNEDEIVGLTFGLYLGGLDTVSSNMGLHFRHLAENPKDQQRLRDKPADIGMAIEEMMRGYAAATTWRTCVGEVDVAGIRIMPGDRVALNTTLASRDGTKYENPNTIDFDRRAQHVSFGHGPHACIGLHLARREMRIGMGEFLEAIPSFRIDPKATIVSTLGGVIQPLTLPLIW